MTMIRRSHYAALRNARIQWATAESVAPPTVTSITGQSMQASGGTVILTGTGFLTMRRALLNANVLDFNVTDDENMTVTFGPQSVTIGHLILETRGGQVYPVPEVYFYPVLTSISPTFGQAGGGDVVTFTGVGFLPAETTVYMYDGVLTQLACTVNSNTELTVTMPDHIPADVLVFVYNTLTGASDSKTYTYNLSQLFFISCTPDHGVFSDLIPVTVVGTGFYGLTFVELEPYAQTPSFVIVNDSMITFSIDGTGLSANPGDIVDFRFIRTPVTDEYTKVAAFTFDP